VQDISSFLTPEGTPERCGIVTKNGEALELENVHDNPLLGFRIDPSEIVLHFSDAIATWHTHPGADPNLSESDYAGFSNWPDLKHYIVGTRDGQPLVLCFEIQDGVVLQA
jgi:proteasome lid subunit RPN8/RPN11